MGYNNCNQNGPHDYRGPAKTQGPKALSPAYGDLGSTQILTQHCGAKYQTVS
jgi:hypothetical protein